MIRLTSHLTRAGAALCLLLCLAAITAAQEPKRGFNPGGSYAISDIETISTSGGNLSLSVPLGGLPAGRGGLTASVNLVYNSKLWDTYQETAYGNNQTYDETRMGISPDGGWRYAFKYELDVDFKYLNNGLDNCDPNLGDGAIQIIKLMITLPDGSRHALRLDGRSAEGDYADVYPDGIHYCQNSAVEFGTLTYFSHDGSFLRLDVEHDSDTDWTNNPWTLYLPDGGRVTGGNAPQRIYDRNNNYIEVVNGTYNSHAATYLNDQVGRSVIVEYNSAANQDTIHARGAYDEPLTWNVMYTTIEVHKTYSTVASPYNRQLNQSLKVVSQITLPSQAGSLSYNFGYNANTANPSYGWGELSSVTLPSGAKSSYSYRLNGVDTVYPTSQVSSKNAVANNPTTKTLVYRPEYDFASSALPSNTACNTQTESCVTETWAYAFAFDTDWAVQDTTLTGPDGGFTKDYFNQTYQDGKNYKTEPPDGTVIERQWQNNTPRTAGSIYINNPSANRINPFVKFEYTSIRDTSGNLTKTAIKEYGQDKNGNVTQVKEYDWLAYGSVPRDSGGKPTGAGSATLKRTTNTVYYNPTPDASDSTTADPDAYHLANTPRLHGLAQASEVQDGSSVTRSRSEFYYDNTGAVGYVSATIANLPSQKTWDSTKGAYSNPLTTNNSVAASTQYNSYGSPTLATDARGTQTQLTYGLVNGYSDLYPTITKVAYGTTVEQVTTQEYDFYSGAVTRETDPNGVATATAYDAFGRPTLVKAAEGIASKETRTATDYSDVYRRVIVRSDLASVGDGKLVSIQHYDQLGRGRLSRRLENAATQSETDETVGIKVQTRYLLSGQNSYTLTSNPYRASSSSAASTESSMGWTRGKADNGGRSIEAQTFSGATLPAPWGANTGSTGTVTTAYDAEFTTVTDQAGKTRRSMTNSLGQLARVDEPDGTTGSLGTTASPVQPTSYTYDVFGNLTLVTQDTQTRSFSYSSLSRLTSAKNPETGTVANPQSGTVSYTYDAGGNLLTKTDGRSITVTYTYDALSRNRTVDYTNTTLNPDIERYYDNPTAGMYGRGRYWHDYKGGNYSAGSEVEHRAVDAYDPLGRPLTQRQMFKTGGTWSGAYTTNRTYTRSGGVQTQTLPSGHTVNYIYDTTGQIQTFTGNLGDDVVRTYSTGITYDEAGRMTREQFGTGTALYHKQRYNARGQLWDMRLSTVDDADNWNRGMIVNNYGSGDFVAWGTSGPNNNGNVLRSHHHVPDDDQINGWSVNYQDYTYDALNRLTSASERRQVNGNNDTAQFAQAYTYDRWGNRTINQGATTQTLPQDMRKEFTVDAQMNRLGVPGNVVGAMTYDLAGNLTHDSYTGKGDRTYDAENRMTSAVIGINSSAVYNYDADGRRVRRSTPNDTVWQVYGLEGELLAEYAANTAASAPQKEYGYRNGELLVTAENPTVAQPVTWMNVVNLTAAGGGSLSKPTSGTSDWTAGAMSTRAIASGDGYVEFSAPENNTARMIGLNTTDTNQSYTDIDFALYPYSDGNMYVFEDGGYVSNLGPYAASDRYRVSIEGGAIKYRKNGTLLYSSARTPQYPLLADTSYYTPGASLSGVVMSGQSVENVGWANAVGVTAAGNNLSKTGTDGWTSGAISQGSIASGDGYAEYSATETNKSRMLGLSHGDSGQSYTDIDFALYAYSDGTLHAYEGGTYAGYLGTYAAGDRLRVAVISGTVKYLKNGVVVGASNTAVTYPLVVDTALYSGGASLTNVVMSGSSGSGGAVQWLVTDHLGTPRMVADLSGSLVGIKRHDYLPFGEKLGSSVGGRTTQQGYLGSADKSHKWWGQLERDDETGLNFAQARYYSNAQGRFISSDPEGVGASVSDPQSWNLYTYGRNNPLIFTDPNGLWHWVDPEKNGKRFLQWDEGDDWTTLAQFLTQECGNCSYRPSDLERSFTDSVPLGADKIVDISSTHPRFTNTGGVEDVSFSFYMGALPAGQGAKGIWGLLKSGVRNLGGMFTRKAGVAEVAALTKSQQSNVNRIYRIIQDHLTERDIQGLVRDVSRNNVPKPGGGTFDHYKEVTEAVNGLRGAVRSLEGSLNNPNMTSATRGQIEQAVGAAKNYITRVEKIIRSH